MLYKIRQMRKIFIFLRIALAKVTKLNHKCLQHLTAILITVFPRNQKPGPKGFCIPTFPSLSPHDSIRRLRDQYIPASSPPHVPSFHRTAEAPKQTSGQPRKWTPPPPPTLQVALGQFWECGAFRRPPGVASRCYYTSPGQTRPWRFWKGLC